MEDRPKLERTWLCSVVFGDIVQYSEQSVALQMAWKERFNRYLSEAIVDVPEPERVIIDTGDGAAICFLGDPEVAMLCACKLVSSLVQAEPGHEVEMRARFGINLGPLKLVKDINGNLNALGDAVNVAQRVMSFAKDNQILVSRSFFEVVSRLSETNSHLFRFEGVRKDKHVREHIVYELRLPGSVPAAEAARDAPEAAEQRAPEPAAAPGLQVPPDALERVERTLAPVIGPIARELVRTAVERAASGEEVCRYLAAFVPGEAERERFLRACQADLSARAAIAPSGEAAAAPAAEWDPAVLERAARDLAVHIGPLARVIVQRASATARGIGELYEALAAEISSPRERERFRRSAPRPAPASTSPAAPSPE
jgi:class 3 adenylate cyclase